MNVHPPPPPVPHADAPASGPERFAATRLLYWSVRRELWEHPSIYVAPLAVSALVLLGFVLRSVFVPRSVHRLAAPGLAQQAAVFTPHDFVAVIVILTTFVVGALYCTEALHGERRDRSLLFWKSLPVSDLTTVLAKACVPVVVLPSLAVAIVVTTQAAMLLVGTLVSLAAGGGAAAAWAQLALIPHASILAYGLAVHALWYAPLYAWLLLLSAWARRAPFLWAVLLPMVLGVLERITFGTRLVASLLRHRLTGAMPAAFDAVAAQSGDVDRLDQLTPLQFLAAPGLWLGLVVAAALLTAAARLRRLREPL